MTVAVIVGARPQFIKAAPLLKHCAVSAQLRVKVVHSGQHFDANMSAVFFEELGLPQPDCQLGVPPGGHGQMTGHMLAGIEGFLLQAHVDQVVVFGDTNTTLAGALAAVKLGIPCAHVEAGLRSWNRSMPEEINRVLVDHCSTWLLCPTEQAVKNLTAEGITRGVHLVGDLMLDAANMFLPLARRRIDVLSPFGLRPSEYDVLTVHRAGNTDDPATLQRILNACGRLSVPVLFPVHPRTRSVLAQGVSVPAQVRLAEPLGYLDMLCVVSHARTVLTDSGGLQKEAYFLGVPCVTLRMETEWVETLAAGWNVLAGTETDRIVEAVREIASAPRTRSAEFGDGTAAEKVCRILADA